MKWVAPGHPTTQWIALAAAAAICTAGLLYNFYLSRTNSREILTVQQRTYPLVEQTQLLNLQLELIRTRFSEAVTLADESRLSLVLDEQRSFVDRLTALEAVGMDRKTIEAVRALFATYFRLGDEVGRMLIRHNNDFAAAQQSLAQFGVAGTQLREAMESLLLASRRQFATALERSETTSRLMLITGLVTSLTALALIGGVFFLIARLNRRLAASNHDLEGQVKARTRELESLVYTISHDLKAPLVSIQGMAAIFADDYGDQVDDTGRHRLQRIIANAKYMEDLILGLLALSRIGRQPGAMQTADVRDVVTEILALQKERLAERHIEVIVHDLPSLTYDRVSLVQIFQNLISNAAKYLGDQPHPRIQIGGRETPEGVVYSVSDNGIGIEPMYHDRIFDVFQRLKDVDTEGTGVGLAIVKKVVHQARGAVWVESTKGRGATFFVRVPRSERAAAPDRLAA